MFCSLPNSAPHLFNFVIVTSLSMPVLLLLLLQYVSGIKIRLIGLRALI
jgi:hypothetical protein